ncbi:RNA polymerase sigma factor [Rhodohalobacter sulfatireducens]|uniref:RNA polymerase sigma factor n=1 Tax=Rhodohalobacter sulfatireducens TaxID=2911366 RepID=A0ABS9KFU0_9BACT|nr:RNA polymerase sigma-70 factor [Rhodohalobacter sulfatireducens]MCG2589727.1 RNA polymerase sigma-70 factor [Rhodohalobacter sulfatireducens]
MALAIHLLLIQLALHSSDDLDSTELLRSIKNGDHDAFRKFFDRHHKHLYYFLLKKGMSEQVAEDLIQQAFLMIWERRKQIDETKSLRAYLFRIAYTRMLNHIRDHKKFSDSAEADSVVTLTPDSTLINEELKEQIDRAIESMPDKRQTVFRLCFLQGFSYKETASTLDISPKTVENHMGLALKDLREALKSFME